MHRFLVVLLGLVALTFCIQLSAEDDTLTIGDKAPSLDVEHWVQNGEGRFKPVTEFEPGKVYIVEFWATWCGPCIESMPHIAQTQARYADKGVQFVSVSDEPLETVNRFLKRKVPDGLLDELASHSGQHADDADEDGEKQQIATFGELTSSYCLTTDPDRSVHESYMTAAGQNGIPAAFLVGKTGQIEWIGHPLEMGVPIAQVVGGRWDREAFKQEFVARQKLNLMVAKLSSLAESKKYGELKDFANEILKNAKPGTMAYRQAASGLEFAQLGLASRDEIIQNLDQLISAEPVDADKIVKLAGMIFSAKQAGDEKIDEAIVKKSIDAMQTAIDNMGEDVDPMYKAFTLQGYAYTLFSLGMKEKAREAAQAAVKSIPESEKANFEKALAPILESVTEDGQ